MSQQNRMLDNNPYYQYPYDQRARRLNQMEQNYMPQYIKCRPVVSIDEARAAQIDLDGSLFVFTDIRNKKIYTKQVSLDGIAVLNTYSLVENEEPLEESYVTKTEFLKAINEMKEEISKGKELSYNDTGRDREIKKSVLQQSSF